MINRIESLPKYLRRYVAEQHYEKYTSLEHASWRFIMRQAREFFSKHAVPIYNKGLGLTGIPIDRIPLITEMDQALSVFGWGAVGVEGFIPSSVFLDLLARKILPIARDMRTLAHLAYTPAPDIVHEAAGHAPIISDAHYRKFLERYSEIAYRAIISRDDIQLYECIRYLSDIKENPDTSPHEIEGAQAKLKAAAASMRYVSEAGKVARLAWWTTEYGLVGNLRQPLIYGAALLSSVGESKSCLSDKVKKIPLSLDCLNYSYDITVNQPQLFVAESLQALPHIIEDLEKTFVYRIGGEIGLAEAKLAETVNSIRLDSGVSISGKMEDYSLGDYGQVEFVRFSGPVQICFEEIQLPGQGRERHPEGFSTPLGRLKQFASKKVAALSNADLRSLGVEVGKSTSIQFTHEFKISGKIKDIVRDEKSGKLILLTWHDCTVKKGDQVYFEPSWGDFDMVVGEDVPGVFCGPADRDAYGDYYVGEASTSPGRKSKFTTEEEKIFSLYTSLREMRTQLKSNRTQVSVQDLEKFSERVYKNFSHHWLLALEIMELSKQYFNLSSSQASWLKTLEESAFAASGENSDVRELMRRGQELLHVID